MENKNPKLYNWRVMTIDDPYKAPEARVGYLVGRVYGHHAIGDGLEIKTSAIRSINFENRIAETASGTIYDLMDPSADYVQWLSDNGLPTAKLLAH